MAGGGDRLKKVVTTKPWLLTLGLAGVLVVLVGAAVAAINFKAGGEPQIEIIGPSPSPEAALETKLLVDVGGAVLSPGVYQFSPDSRINDALVRAGGLAQDADRDWISLNLNLAAKLTDGAKIYVPWKEGEGTNKDSPRSNLQGLSLKDQININTASLADLDTLWGVGPVTAQKIIDNRPYAQVSDLLERKIVKTNVYEAIKDEIAVY